MTADMATQVEQLVPAALLGAFGAVFALGFLQSWLRERNNTTDTERTETIRRNSDYCNVVYENTEGWGYAVVESDGGIALKSFDSDDKVWQDVWISPSALDNVTDALSVKACERQHELAQEDSL